MIHAMLAEYEFSMIMLVFCALLVLVTLAFVVRKAFSRQAGEIGGWELRGAGGRIAAVARITVTEGLRTKLAVTFIVLVLGFTLLFWWFARGDGTIKGQIQMFLTYTIGLSGFLIALLTIFFSCRSLSMEVSSRQIYGVVSKPIPRWQILVGKWTGVMFLNVVLVTVTCLAAYVGTVTTLGKFKSRLTDALHSYGKLTPDQAAAAVAALDNIKGVGGKGYDSPVIPIMAQALGKTNNEIAEMLLALPEEMRVDIRRFDELRRQVLVARGTVTPEPPEGLKETVEKIFQAMKKEGRIPPNRTNVEARERIRARLKKLAGTVPTGIENARQWKLRGPKPQKGRDLFMSIRYKIEPSKYLDAVPEFNLEEERIRCAWFLGTPGPEPPRFYESGPVVLPVSSMQEFEIPAQCVADDGTILVGFANLDPRRVDAVFDLPWGLQVLYRVGTFETNVFQVGLALLIPLACLAALGVCASTFLSFPVAALIVITLYVMSVSIGFVAESLGTTRDFYDPENIPKEVRFRQKVVGAMKWGLALGDCEPTMNLIEGRAITWQTLWQNTWRFVLVKGGVTMAIGVLVFRRRELAAVIV